MITDGLGILFNHRQQWLDLSIQVLERIFHCRCQKLLVAEGFILQYGQLLYRLGFFQQKLEVARIQLECVDRPAIRPFAQGGHIAALIAAILPVQIQQPDDLLRGT